MSLRNPRPLTMLTLAVWLLVGLAVAFVLSLAFPQELYLAIGAALVAVAGITGAAYWGIGRRWVIWLVFPTAGLAGLGAVMLGEDLALTESGERIEAVVVDHSVEVRDVVRKGRTSKAYTHRYTLERTDGQPIEEPMEYRGEGGFDGVEEGSTIEVFVDPDGRAPTKPTDSVDLEADVAILVVGLVAVAGAFGVCARAVSGHVVTSTRY